MVFLLVNETNSFLTLSISIETSAHGLGVYNFTSTPFLGCFNETVYTSPSSYNLSIRLIRVLLVFLVVFKNSLTIFLVSLIRLTSK